MSTDRPAGLWWARARSALHRRLGNRPRVTVVIPTYNWATVLPWSIGSVQAQTMPDWELWVVGDGCTDESAAVVAAIDDPRVHWHNLPENGRSQAGPNNEALRRARADYVAYLGHDDLWLPDHLERLCRALDAGAPFVHGHQLRIDPGQGPYLWPPDGWSYGAGLWIPPTSVMHRRRDALAVGGWRFPDECGDCDPEADLWARISDRCGPPVLIEDVTSVKLPAVMRKGVYRERPCDEQAAWWHRITASADSASFVAAAVADSSLRPPARYAAAEIPPEFLGQAPATAAERHRMGRRLKGLDD